MNIPLDFTNSQYDLSGSAGNAWAVMGTIQKLLEEFGLENEAQRYIKEAKAGNYENLLLVSDRYVQLAWVFPEGEHWEEVEQRLLDARQQSP